MSQHQAREVSLKSREYVHAHNKEGWLSLFAEDGVIEDPIGPSYLDPEGKGHRTVQEREAFWDSHIANSKIEIIIHQSYSVGPEVANHVTLLTVFEYEGQRMQQEVNGVFTYEVDGEGKLKALRGYWELEAAMKTIKPVTE
jgi:steroid Delta-isomerase